MSNSVISYKDYVNNYGVVYQTTGGRRKAGTAGKKVVGGVSVREFITKIANNRVLDLYLKFMGITTLTTTTLVPVALLMGDEVFTKTVNKMTTEGEVEKGKIPILDDTLAAQYLKIAGLTTLTIAPATLIPLGVAMAIWQMYENSQGQTGGSRTIFGSTIPQNFGQRVDNTISGIPNSSINIFPEQNDQLALACATGDCKPSLAGVDLPNNTVAIKGLPTAEIPNKVAQAGFVGVTDENGLSPAPLNMMGGRRKRQALLRKLRGGGSAWAMSQYSRGPVNYPNQNIADFRAFTKTGEYIPNTAFYPTPWFKPTPLDNVKTLYEQSPYLGDPTGYGVQGVATAPFSVGGKRRLSKKKATKRGGFKDIGDSPDGPFTPSQLVNMQDLSGSMTKTTGDLNPMKGGGILTLPGSDGAQPMIPEAKDINTSVGDWSGKVPIYANADASEGYPTYKLGNSAPTYSVPAQPFTGGRRKKDLGEDLSGYFN